MKLLFSALLISMCACGKDSAHIPPIGSYSGQWLQLDQYFSESCFILDESTKTVWVFDDGEEEQTHKDDWLWEYNDLDLYVFNDNISLYVVETENDCWRMSIWGVDVNACPCSFAIPPQPPEE